MTDNDLRLFTCPDLFPDGQTGYDLTRDQRATAREYYRALRQMGCDRRGSQLRTAVKVRHLDNGFQMRRMLGE